jgi:hypothetical protein
MSVLKPRNRLVNFRLSEEEFQGLKTACEASGARSLSDFARSAVLLSMERVGEGKVVPGEQSVGPLARLGRTVETLESRVEQILAALNGGSGSNATGQHPDASAL